MMWVFKLLNEFKSSYINSLSFVKVKRDESECFRSDSVVRQGCIMSLWLFNVYMDVVMKEVKMGKGDCWTFCVQITLLCSLNRKSI